jgi:CubicO group peptidase (beta-lactamase class C family)
MKLLSRLCLAVVSIFVQLTAQPGDPHIDAILRKTRLVERMKELHVPAVSVALIEDGRIAWAKAWGAADPETVFQAASISKPVAAMAAMHMSQHGNFALDEDVNGKLKSWKVPESEFTKEKKVTLRGLLSHSAGMTVHGFPGYAVDAPLPALLQILNGTPPANTRPIIADMEPGSKWRYSGGGYTVLQQLMMDRMGWEFPQIMDRMVLGRIGMKRSTYQQPLPEAWHANAASGHLRDGQPVKGRWHVYPEMAAAGLWTTPSDLARWAIELRNAYTGKSNKIIERNTAREMLTRQSGSWGLGVQLHKEGAALAFSHGGSNAGYRCGFLMFAESGNGVVVMTNGDQGGPIVEEWIRATRQEYGWPAVSKQY